MVRGEHINCSKSPLQTTGLRSVVRSLQSELNPYRSLFVGPVSGFLKKKEKNAFRISYRFSYGTHTIDMIW